MSNEEMFDSDSDLELEEKLVVAGVLLLAGLFFWSLLGNEEKQGQIFKSIKEDEVVDTQSFFYEQEVEVVEGERKRPVSVTKNRMLTKKNDSIFEPVPQVEVKKVEKTEAPVIAAPVTEIIETSSSESIAEILPTETIKKVIPQPVKRIIPPTIKPLFGDLSQGILKLSGTGEPKGTMQLLVNGSIAAYIGLDEEGLWNYETVLKPGDYSIQVLMTDAGETIKSPLSHITIPQPPVVEVEEAIIESSEIVIPKVIENKPEIIDRASDTQALPTDGDRYRVKYGDTLNKLSKRYNLTVSQLAKINNISDKDVITVGQMLIIPGH